MTRFTICSLKAKKNHTLHQQLPVTSLENVQYSKTQALQMLQSFAAGVADERTGQLHLLMGLLLMDVCSYHMVCDRVY